MEPDIQRLCNELLDKVKAKGENRFDVVDDYAYPVPVCGDLQDSWAFRCRTSRRFTPGSLICMAGFDVGPDAATDEGKARAGEGPRERRGAPAVHG